ncbi:DUF3291 domain-containing protein [Rubrivirga sp.]|uniref:DUF3291 domain-containing protein n=1 Tax=Rubrivirga sp. TaxID=1885344 RepID=UPI003C77FFEF
MTHHIAQVNVGRILGPMDGEVMAEFQRALDPINLLAERTPGFVWRLQDGDDATSLRPFEDDTVLVNMSVWESVEALRDYTYQSGHTHYVKRRKEWFQNFGRPHYALWWVPAGHHPTPLEAGERLDALHADGPTSRAFTFTKLFDPPALEDV